MAGTLYIVGTPIGNLADTSQRVLDTLKGVELILAEDTRVTKKLLMHFDINRTVESYHQHSSIEKKLGILNKLLNGVNMALVSDAGTPGVSDPGNELLEFLYENGVSDVIPVPGPSAVTAALSVCGFNVSKFLFIGFWPKKKGKKTVDLIKLAGVPVVFFESPNRIVKTLERLAENFGDDRRVFVGRELTKKFETHYRGGLQEVLGKLNSESSLKGEVVVVLE